MTDTTFATVPASDPETLAVGHDLGGQPVPSWHQQAILPAGGIRSSLADMLRFLRCNLGQGPLAAACLFAQQSRAAGTPGHRIGLVWETSVLRGSVSHGGDTAGYHAFVAISNDHQSGVVALSNGPLVTDIATHHSCRITRSRSVRLAFPPTQLRAIRTRVFIAALAPDWSSR